MVHATAHGIRLGDVSHAPLFLIGSHALHIAGRCETNDGSVELGAGHLHHDVVVAQGRRSRIVARGRTTPSQGAPPPPVPSISHVAHIALCGMIHRCGIISSRASKADVSSRRQTYRIVSSEAAMVRLAWEPSAIWVDYGFTADRGRPLLVGLLPCAADGHILLWSLGQDPSP